MKLQFIRQQLTKIISESTHIKNTLSKLSISKFKNEITKLSDNHTLKLLFLLNEKKNSKTNDLLKTGLILTGLAVIAVTPGAIPMSIIIKKIIDSYNWKCEIKCRQDKRVTKQLKLCYHKCHILSLKKAEVLIKSELSKCKYTKNPQKCQSKLYKSLLKIKEKQVDADMGMKQFQRKMQNK